MNLKQAATALAHAKVNKVPVAPATAGNRHGLVLQGRVVWGYNQALHLIGRIACGQA